MFVRACIYIGSAARLHLYRICRTYVGKCELSFAVWHDAFCGRLSIASESTRVSRYEKKGGKRNDAQKVRRRFSL